MTYAEQNKNMIKNILALVSDYETEAKKIQRQAREVKREMDVKYQSVDWQSFNNEICEIVNKEVTK